MPAITVLIPAHNASRTLEATLASLAAQTLRDFQVLVVDDASSDDTGALARGFGQGLALDVLRLERNAGVAGALNQGLARIQTPYIARLDADDLATPDRLEQQYRFLEARPEIAVASSWIELFYDDGRPSAVLPKPEHDAAIKTALVQYCSMTHGASLFRKSFFDDVGVFDTRLDFAEDYDLWTRGALLGKRYANLQLVLTRYRQHSGQVGVQKRQLQYERDLMVKRKYIGALLDGQSPGYLAEFFSMLTSFTNRDIAMQVVEQSMPLLFRLGSQLPDQDLYAQIVAGCLRRHLHG